MLQLVYSPRYDIRAFGLEKLHPFDSCRASRAWKLLQSRLGRKLNELLIRPQHPVRNSVLGSVHSGEYLAKLQDAKYVARALEVAAASKLPARVLDYFVLRPMRLATMGTIVAAEAAVRSGLAINLAGGFHHAKPDNGEGFCVYADAGIAVSELRRSGQLGPGDVVVYVDLDVHQGNGVCHVFLEDRSFYIFDAFNPRIYPSYDHIARDRIDCAVPLPPGCGDSEYLTLLEKQLPAFLDSISRGRKVGLAIYNAGSDVYEGDALGGLKVSAAGVLRRDLLVLKELRGRQFPTVMLPSGGYSEASHQMLAATIEHLLSEHSKLR